jgi:ABC-2 type transport system permease protein
MNLLRIELFKVFTRRRSYIGFAAVLALVVLVLLAFYSEGNELFSFITRNLEETVILKGKVLNGNTYAYLVMKSLWVHFPVLVALVTGDLFSGEEQSGTFRIVLSRPVSRGKLVTAKFASAIIYVTLLVLVMALTSIGLGHAVFGAGDLLVLMDHVNIFVSEDVLWRFGGAYIFGIISMSTIAALSVFLSAITRSSIAAILGTIALVIVLTFLSLSNIPLLQYLQPILFTTYTSSWQAFFQYETDSMKIAGHAAVLISYVFVFYLITLIYFRNKDILS